MTRRTFSFASLVLTSTPALADGLSTDTKGGVQLASAAEVTPKGSELVVRLSVVNTSDVALDVLVELGNRPGPDLRVFLVDDDEGQDIELAEETSGIDRRAVMSRMGPRPRYEALAIGGRLEFGRWTYTLPAGADHDAFRVVAHVTVAQATRPIELVHVLRANGGAAV